MKSQVSLKRRSGGAYTLKADECTTVVEALHDLSKPAFSEQMFGERIHRRSECCHADCTRAQVIELEREIPSL